MTTTHSEKRRGPIRLLLSPWTILVAMATGICIGVYNKPFAGLLAPFGKIYLALLQMCVLPVLLTAVSSGLGRLARSRGGGNSIRKMLAVFLLGLFSVSALGLIGGMVGKPGSGLDENARKVLSRMVEESGHHRDLRINFNGPPLPREEPPGMIDFFTHIVPPNIAAAMASGSNLQVLFFAIILGISMGFIPPPQVDAMFLVLEGTYFAFSKVINGAMYALPFGLCCLLADQVAQIGPEILVAMTRFISVFYISSIALVLFNTLIIWRRSGTGPGRALMALKEPALVALATRSSLASIPAALTALHKNLGFQKETTNLLVPLGVTVCRYGNVFFFALGTTFVAQIYGTDLTGAGLGIALVGSILAGMATAGATGILTLAMIGIVLQPLGLPLEAVLVLFIAVDPIVDPLRSLLIVHTACTATCVVAPRQAMGSAIPPTPQPAPASNFAVSGPAETRIIP